MSDDKISISELIEAVRENICYPYGGEPYIDVHEFLDHLYTLKASKEQADES